MQKITMDLLTQILWKTLFPSRPNAMPVEQLAFALIFNRYLNPKRSGRELSTVPNASRAEHHRRQLLHPFFPTASFHRQQVIKFLINKRFFR